MSVELLLLCCLEKSFRYMGTVKWVVWQRELKGEGKKGKVVSENDSLYRS